MADGPIRPSGNKPVPLDSLVTRFSLDYRGSLNNASVSGVTLSDQAVQPGDLFVALPGRAQHGARYATSAIAAGATAILTDPGGVDTVRDIAVPVLVTDSPRALLGHIAKTIYDPGVPLPQVLAVTGTNGKTSVAFYIEAIARAVGQVTGLSNSTERRVAGEVFHTPLTTPEAPELHALLAVAAERGVQTFALEASAQAIERHRLDGVPIVVSGFTNLSHDHFEDYGDMDNYLRHKLPLFHADMSQRAVVSLESEWGQKVVDHATIPLVTLAGVGTADADWTWESIGHSDEGQRFELVGPAGRVSTSISAPGEHMVRNAALAIVMLLESGVVLEQLSEAIDVGRGGINLVVPGRIEKVSGASPVAVYVDAGRSADAYLNTFRTLRDGSSGALVVVCGTSGNRDRSKRADMGRLAAEYGDLVVITDDDPRMEDPAQIRADLLAGARAAADNTVVEVPNPSEAIRYAISQAAAGDTIVWMGPGSQTYREVKGVRQPFSARTEVQTALREAGLLT